MAGKNLNPLLGWHAAPDVAAYVRAEAERRHVRIAVVLDGIVRREMERAGFRCPRCGTVNRNPLDVRECFCVRCSDVTDPAKIAEYERNASS